MIEQFKKAAEDNGLQVITLGADTFSPNYRHVAGYHYVVKNVEGLDEATAHFVKEWKKNDLEASYVDEVHGGIPEMFSAYPALVTFRIELNAIGDSYVFCDSIEITALQKALDEMMIKKD